MKVKVEVKVQGAFSGRQADTTLLFSKGVSAKNIAFLDEMDDPHPVDYSSLCMFRSPYNGSFVIAHWQTGFESFPQNGRFYCTRALYEIDAKDVEKCDYSSLVSALPRLEHYADKRFDIEPFNIEIGENRIVSSGAIAKLLKYIWLSIAAGKRLFIRLDKTEDCYANSLLESSRLHCLLKAMNLLPASVRNAASLGFSLKASDAARLSDSLFAGLGIVAYYPDPSFDDLATGNIIVSWNDRSLVPAADYSEYEKTAEDLKAASAMIGDTEGFYDWQRMCAMVAESKAKIDSAIKSKNYEVLIAAYRTCSYRKQEVLASLLASIGGSASPSVADIQFLAEHAQKTEGLGRLLANWIKSSSVSVDVKLEIQDKFASSQEVKTSIREMSDSLSIKERFSRFGTSLCELTYSDLSLEKVSDDEFLEIYRNLYRKTYPNVELSKVPGSNTFPRRYAKVIISRDPDMIVNEKGFQSFVTGHHIADERFLADLFSIKLIRTPEQLMAWSACVENTLQSGLVSRYLSANSQQITCVDLLKLKLGSSLTYAYEECLKEKKMPLGDLVGFCRDISDDKKKLAYEMLADRKISSLEEWEQVQTAFGRSADALRDDFFKDPQSGNVNFQEYLRIYTKYPQAEVKEYIEKSVLSLAAQFPDNKQIKGLISSIGKVSKGFKEKNAHLYKNPVKDFMFSPKGAEIAWGLSACLIVVIIILSVIMNSSKEKLVKEEPILMPTDTTSVVDSMATHSDTLENGIIE